MRHRSWSICSLIVAATAVAVAAQPARADGPPSAILVVDGSGSFWGELGTDRRSKFDIAREGIHAALAKVSPDNRIGLMSFGHRRKGDCSDVELIVPPDAGPQERVGAPLDKISPRGKGPLVLAMREAGKALAGAPGPASIIVVHDGPDNCGQDACAAAADLAKSNPKLRVHLIGLGLDRGEAQRIACVPRQTGGKMFEANDAATASASINEAFSLANLLDAAPKEPEPSAPAPEASASDSEGPPRIRLSATLSEGGAILTTPLRWRIFKGDDKTAVLERVAAEVSEPLGEGKYRVEVHSGLVLSTGTVDVAREGLTRVSVALNAGWIKIAAKAAKTGDALQDAIITLSRNNTADGGKIVAHEPIWLGRSETEIFVPAGSYSVRLDSGLVNDEQIVSLAPGGRAIAEFTPALGSLELSAVYQDGGPSVRDAIFTITEDDPDGPQGRREITRSAHPEPRFSLPAGTYYVTARAGTAEVRQRIAIGPGDVVKKIMILDVGRAEVSATLGAGALPADARVQHKVLTNDAEPREIARSTANPATFELPAGRFRVETALADGNVVTSSDIDVQTGKDIKVVQALQAAQVTVQPGAAAGASRSAWELRDARGQVVLRAGRPESRTALLAPGRYMIRGVVQDRPHEAVFELKAGEQRVVDLAAP